MGKEDGRSLDDSLEPSCDDSCEDSRDDSRDEESRGNSRSGAEPRGIASLSCTDTTVTKPGVSEAPPATYSVTYW